MDRRPEGNAIEQSGLFASTAPVSQLKQSRSVPLSLGRIIRCRLAVVHYRGRQSAESLLRRGRRSSLVYVQNTLFSASGQE